MPVILFLMILTEIKSLLPLKIFIPICIIVLLNITSCGDSPSSIGSDLLKDDLITLQVIDSQTDSLPQSSHSFKKAVRLGNASRLLVGRSAGVEAASLIRFFFYFPDSITKEILNDQIQVVSSKVTLLTEYSLGEETSSYGITVHRIRNSWTQETFTSDSISLLQFDSDDVATNKVYDDSVHSFNIDNEMVKSWLQSVSDTAKPIEYGIYIKAENGTGRVVGYSAYTGIISAAPSLEVVIEKQGVYVDTLSFTPAADVSVVLGEIPDAGSENIIVMAGLTAKTKLYFDLSGLAKGAVINKAELTLFVDDVYTNTGSDYKDGIIAAFIEDSTNSDSTSYKIKLSGDGEIFIGNITVFVQKWLDSGSNQGMLLSAEDELNGLELFALKGSNAANVLQRPKLKIYFTNKP